MADRVINNPIINSPYRVPARHFAFDNDGITDRIVEGRRESSYFVPVPRPAQARGQQQLEFAELTADQIEKNQFVNEIRARVARWRELGRPDVTPVTRRLLEYWTDPERDNPMLFCQLEAAETAIYLAEAAQKGGRCLDPQRARSAKRGAQRRAEPDRAEDGHRHRQDRGDGDAHRLADPQQGGSPERRPLRQAVPGRHSRPDDPGPAAGAAPRARGELLPLRDLVPADL